VDIETVGDFVVGEVDTVEEKPELWKIQEVHVIPEYLAEDDNLDKTLVVYSDTVADEALCSAVVDMVVAVVEMVLVVVVAVAVEGKADHIENMGEVLLRLSLKRRLDHEGDSVEVDGCLCCLGDSLEQDL
jgi:hypothetical protein